MSERSNPRVAGMNDQIVFHDHHAPALKGSHNHKISVKQHLKVRDGDDISGEASLTIRVKGPQNVLPKGSVVATFPADVSSGKYYAALPHITMSRGTLPWERMPASGGAVPRPWMVLLILDEDEMKHAEVLAATASKLPSEIDHADTAKDAKVSFLKLDAAVVASHFPELDDLPWLAHVRHIAPGGQNNETSTIIAARLPTPGKQNHAFLLSVENRYGAKHVTHHGAAKLSFAILHQWSFVCEAEHRHGFAELLSKRDGNAIVPKPFALSGGTAETADIFAAGYVPVEHRLRNGTQSVAWYHGPLLPGIAPVAAKLIEAKLPVAHADDLMLLDQDFAMFDVSYASAWELGRMIVLEHTDVALEIAHWKQMVGRDALRAGQTNNVKALHAANLPSARPHLPDHLADWIRRGLLEMREVPFINLVADEELLPEGEFRFFDVDQAWLECLRDGALSVGRTDGHARDVEEGLRKHLEHPRQLSGFLLRSGAVSDFPSLEVDGYGAVSPAKGEFDKPALPVIRMERISNSVLMVLFEGRVQTVDVHLHPQALHFGFEHQDINGVDSYTKDVTLKNRSGSATVTAQNGGMNDLRVVKMSEVAKQFKITKKTGAGGVSEFAARMLEGVPLVRFTRTVRNGP